MPVKYGPYTETIRFYDLRTVVVEIAGPEMPAELQDRIVAYWRARIENIFAKMLYGGDPYKSLSEPVGWSLAARSEPGPYAPLFCIKLTPDS